MAFKIIFIYGARGLPTPHSAGRNHFWWCSRKHMGCRDWPRSTICKASTTLALKYILSCVRLLVLFWIPVVIKWLIGYCNGFLWATFQENTELLSLWTEADISERIIMSPKALFGSLTPNVLITPQFWSWTISRFYLQVHFLQGGDLPLPSKDWRIWWDQCKTQLCPAKGPTNIIN